MKALKEKAATTDGDIEIKKRRTIDFSIKTYGLADEELVDSVSSIEITSIQEQEDEESPMPALPSEEAQSPTFKQSSP
tara:strand:- start:189 stop:422 length:234 start_codon:yes stop_codon:yes gene_type:complete